MNSSRILKALLSATFLCRADMADSLLGIQTGIDYGSSFAGGMTFDKYTNRLFLTGSTYARGLFEPFVGWYNGPDQEFASDCFLATLQLDNSSTPQWINPMRVGNHKDPEACSTMLHIDDHDRVFLGGATTAFSQDKYDIDGDQLPMKKDVSLLGHVMSMPLDKVYETGVSLMQHYVFGGRGYFHSEVNYPFALATDYQHNATGDGVPVNQSLYVASVHSQYEGELWEGYPFEEEDEWDFTSPYLRGNVFSINIQKLNLRYSNATDGEMLMEEPLHMERAWMQSFETVEYEAIRPGGMIYVNGMLLLAGSTPDVSDKYGGNQRDYQGQDDWDGFILKLDPETGNVPTIEQAEQFGANSVRRFQTTYGKNEFIEALCLAPPESDGQVKYVYAVGTTTGVLDDTGDFGGAFLVKYDINTLYPVWERQVHGDNVRGVDCAASDDGSVVYVTGVVEDGGALRNYEDQGIIHESNGGDDVFVAKFDAYDAHAHWAVQLGSEADDSVAKNGAITIGLDGNPMIFGNTRGSMGREKSELYEDCTNDLFVMSLDKDTGAYLPPDPTLQFQVPRTMYQGVGGELNWKVILYAVVGAIFLLLLVLLIHASWVPLRTYFPCLSYCFHCDCCDVCCNRYYADDDDDYSDESESLKRGKRGSRAGSRTAGSRTEVDDFSESNFDSSQVDGGSMQAPAMEEINSLLHDSESADPVQASETPADVSDGYYAPPTLSSRQYSEEEKVEDV